MDISVIIPTRDRPAKLAQCLRHLRDQTIRPSGPLCGRYEVLVGVDGPDGVSAAAAVEAWGKPAHADLRVVECPRAGLAAVRNALLPLARGRWVVSLNDDLFAEPGFLETHARSQAQAEHDGRSAIIVGDSPWRIFDDDSLFDRLIRESSMIFFYDRMHAAPEAEAVERDWGFRHCFGLNFSVATEALRDIGGFAVFPATYGYEDTEAAWRLRERFGMPVLYRPGACGVHDHRYTPTDYLAREEKLGHAAWGFALTSPACAMEMFGRDITSDAEVEYSREFVIREAKTAERLRSTLEGMARIPSDVIDEPHAPEFINALYEQHLLLKRWLWRRGLARAASEALAAA